MYCLTEAASTHQLQVNTPLWVHFQQEMLETRNKLEGTLRFLVTITCVLTRVGMYGYIHTHICTVCTYVRMNVRTYVRMNICTYILNLFPALASTVDRNFFLFRALLKSLPSPPILCASKD